MKIVIINQKIPNKFKTDLNLFIFYQIEFLYIKKDKFIIFNTKKKKKKFITKFI